MVFKVYTFFDVMCCIFYLKILRIFSRNLKPSNVRIRYDNSQMIRAVIIVAPITVPIPFTIARINT